MLTDLRGDLGTLSLNEVEHRVGMSKPALLREFGGADGLIAAVLDRYREDVIASTLATLVGERPFVEVLRDLLAAMTTPRDPTRLPLGRGAVGAVATRSCVSIASRSDSG